MSLLPSRLALAAGCLAVLPTATASAAILPSPGGTASPGADTTLTGFDPRPNAFWAPAEAFDPAGDVNGDGRADLVTDQQPARILFGASSRATVSRSAAASRLWTINASWQRLESTENAPLAIRPAGDVNRDGRGDVVVLPDPGLQLPAATGQTIAAILPGPTAARTSSVDADAIVRLTATSPEGRAFVAAASTLGDVNGDGYADVGVDWWEGITILYGGPGLTGSIDLAAPGSNGFRIRVSTSFPATYEAGSPVGLGDTNGDGLDEFAVARPASDAKQYVYTVFGRTGRSADLDLDNRPAGRASRVGPVNSSSTAVPLGDLNKDGFDDVAYELGNDATFVLRGRTSTADVTTARVGQKINWALHPSGAPADVNGDGTPDFVGALTNWSAANESDRIMAGAVVFGNATGASITLPTLASTTSLGVRFPGSDVSSLGDVDGDGRADLGTATGIVYGYGPGTQPDRDTTAPTLSWQFSYDYSYGVCGVFPRNYTYEGGARVSLSEPATLELTAVQNGVTRKATLGLAAGEQTVKLPASLIARSTRPVTITAAAVDPSGNRSAAVSATWNVKNNGWTIIC